MIKKSIFIFEFCCVYTDICVFLYIHIYMKHLHMLQGFSLVLFLRGVEGTQLCIPLLWDVALHHDELIYIPLLLDVAFIDNLSKQVGTFYLRAEHQPGSCWSYDKKDCVPEAHKAEMCMHAFPSMLVYMPFTLHFEWLRM